MYLKHEGVKYKSGRYPYGSGENPFQHDKRFLARYRKLKSEGLSDKDIAKEMNISTVLLRAKRSIEREAEEAANAAKVYRMREKGMSYSAIAEKLGYGNESSVRTLMSRQENSKKKLILNTAIELKNAVDNKGYIDVGLGSNQQLGVNKSKMRAAIEYLKDQGYVYEEIKVKQLTGQGYTTYKVLAPKGTDKKEIYKNRDKITQIADIGVKTDDGGLTYKHIEKPKQISKDRVSICYSEDGGKEKDGLIEIRRGVEDLNMGHARYAQVRIGVDGTSYLKGMAVYKDGKDMPPGKDIVFNTNKSKGTPFEKVLKPQKYDETNPNNPFGASIDQITYTDKNGKEQLSAVNIVNKEGDWSNWKKKIASQMLSKQPQELAKRQLSLSYASARDELNTIKSLTNPELKKKLLDTYADNCDSQAVSLKAAALPGQSSSVLIPFPSIKENEIYAPNYRNGQKVVLIRYPHGGIFEIPTLTVNNKNKDAKSTLGSAPDAVGINAKTAEILSGADFDGDTVLVIPNDKGDILTSKPLTDLKDYDPKVSYPKYEGMPIMKEQLKQQEMGKISNLITDMTIKGAKNEEIARAVRHSMTVIDAVKHELDYKTSYEDNRIGELKKIYQDGGGASTLISRAKGQYRIPERKAGVYKTDPITGKTKKMYIDPETGEKLYTETGRMLTTKKQTNPDGTYSYVERTKPIPVTIKTTQMAATNDARTLSSGYKIENLYADYANKLKSLANKARKEMVNTPSQKINKSAKNVYSDEVKSLKEKIAIVEKNKPLERQALALASTLYKIKLADNPDMDNDDKKKAKDTAMRVARYKVGKEPYRIDITDREWQAIQAGAIGTTDLQTIFASADLDKLKERAMPRANPNKLPASKIALIKAKLASGFTQDEVAKDLGISVSTVNKYNNKED